MDLKTVHEGVHRHKRRKRLGRGPGSKRGRYATRGCKGQIARTGDNPKLMKEGGQMPLFRRVPKRGFNNPFKLVYAVINVVDLGSFSDGQEVNLDLLKTAGFLNHPHDRVKILGDGELTKKLTVHAHSFSVQAKEKIEKAGGKCELIPTPHRGPKIRNKMRPRAPKVPLA